MFALRKTARTLRRALGRLWARNITPTDLISSLSAAHIAAGCLPRMQADMVVSYARSIAVIPLFHQSGGVSLIEMPAQADIIVSSPDSTEVKLVVEAKLQSSELQKTEQQFKNFMLQLRCP